MVTPPTPHDKTAAVVIDARKLPVFKKHLDAAGYGYEEPTAFPGGTLLLKVRYDWVHKIKPVLEAAISECDAMVPQGGINHE